MTAAEVLQRLRRFLLILAILMSAGTLVELWLVNHTEDAIQWIAFGLAGLGIIAPLLFLIRQQPKSALILRLCMVVIVLGSGFGIFEHVWNNLQLEREINPNSPTSQMILKALGGANPLLAPGALAVAALLALAATYQHAIGSREIEQN